MSCANGNECCSSVNLDDHTKNRRKRIEVQFFYSSRFKVSDARQFKIVKIRNSKGFALNLSVSLHNK